MRVKNSLVIALFLLSIGAFTLFVMLNHYMGCPSAYDFNANQGKYVAIVDYIAKMNIPPSQTVQLYCDKWDVRTIKQVQIPVNIMNTFPVYNIEAKRLADGRLVVVLMTQTGHGGNFGYIYCSGSLNTPSEIGPDTWGGSQTSIKVADYEWRVDDTLPGGWWVVSNNLD